MSMENATKFLIGMKNEHFSGQNANSLATSACDKGLDCTAAEMTDALATFTSDDLSESELNAVAGGGGRTFGGPGTTYDPSPEKGEIDPTMQSPSPNNSPTLGRAGGSSQG